MKAKLTLATASITLLLLAASLSHVLGHSFSAICLFNSNILFEIFCYEQVVQKAKEFFQ